MSRVLRIAIDDGERVSDAIHEFIDAELKDLPLSDGEKDAVRDIRFDVIQEQIGHWVHHGSEICIDIDLNANTAEVVS